MPEYPCCGHKQVAVARESGTRLRHTSIVSGTQKVPSGAKALAL